MRVVISNVAGSADARHSDVLHAQGRHLKSIGLPEVQGRSPLPCVQQGRGAVTEDPMRRFDHVFAYLVAARSNRWPNAQAQVGRLAVEDVDHGADHLLGDESQGTPPAGVGRADDAAHRVHNDDRHTVGTANEQVHVGVGAQESIGLGHQRSTLMRSNNRYLVTVDQSARDERRPGYVEGGA